MPCPAGIIIDPGRSQFGLVDMLEMASAELPSVESIHETILRDGLYFSKDPLIGQQVAKMNEDGTPFASATGLQFCVDNVVGNLVSIETISFIGFMSNYAAHSTHPQLFSQMVWPRPIQARHSIRCGSGRP